MFDYDLRLSWLIIFFPLRLYSIIFDLTSPPKQKWKVESVWAGDSLLVLETIWKKVPSLLVSKFRIGWVRLEKKKEYIACINEKVKMEPLQYLAGLLGFSQNFGSHLHFLHNLSIPSGNSYVEVSIRLYHRLNSLSRRFNKLTNFRIIPVYTS